VVNVPFSKLTDGRIVTIYKEYLSEFIKKSTEDIDLKLKEYFIRAEIQKRDFTKRQLNILTLIMTFSYNYGKESALLKITDFQLSGIPAKKETKEINQLIESGVITWDKDFNEFSITNPTSWKVKYHEYYDDKRSIELFLINLKHAGFDTAAMMQKLNEMENK
jgi:hypothetical protein